MVQSAGNFEDSGLLLITCSREAQATGPGDTAPEMGRPGRERGTLPCSCTFKTLWTRDLGAKLESREGSARSRVGESPVGGLVGFRNMSPPSWPKSGAYNPLLTKYLWMGLITRHCGDFMCVCEFEISLGSLENKTGAGDLAQLVESLLSRHESLCSTPSTTQARYSGTL